MTAAYLMFDENMSIHDMMTQDFCDTFVTQDRCRGAIAKFIAFGYLPGGVYKHDPRVVQIVKWCQEWCRQEKEKKNDS